TSLRLSSCSILHKSMYSYIVDLCSLSFIKDILSLLLFTFFPYTTLFRSGDAHEMAQTWVFIGGNIGARKCDDTGSRCHHHGERRSEEHTSELQSRFDIV